MKLQLRDKNILKSYFVLPYVMYKKMSLAFSIPSESSKHPTSLVILLLHLSLLKLILFHE